MLLFRTCSLFTCKIEKLKIHVKYVGFEIVLKVNLIKIFTDGISFYGLTFVCLRSGLRTLFLNVLVKVHICIVHKGIKFLANIIRFVKIRCNVWNSLNRAVSSFFGFLLL